MIVTYRVRLNVRLPDAEKKYRDELTQEAEVSIDESDLTPDTPQPRRDSSNVQGKALELRAQLLPGGKPPRRANYQETP